MSVFHLLDELRRDRIDIRLTGERLVVGAKETPIRPELLRALRERKSEVIAFLREVSAAAGPPAGHAPIPAAAARDHYAVSHAQKRLWVLDQLRPGLTAYHISSAHCLEGDLDVPVLNRAFDELVRRHESLRTSFAFVDGQPVQQVHPPGAFSFQIEIEREAPDGPTAGCLDERVKAYPGNVRFDLSAVPLLRARLFAAAPPRHLLVLVIHHIVADAWSVRVLMEELTSLYESFRLGRESSLPALPIQCKDYTAWQHARLAGDGLQPHEAYWLNRFAGELPVLDLPADFPRPARRDYAGASRFAFLPQSTVGRLRAVGTAAGATLFMVLMATVKALLYRYTGDEDIVVGTTTTGRVRPELRGQIGFFVNTLPLRTAFSGKENFRALLDRVRAGVVDAFEHETYPFDQLVEKLALPNRADRNPLFDVLVEFIDQDLYAGNPIELPRLRISEYLLAEHTSKFDLSVRFLVEPEGIRIHLEYDTALFGPRKIASLAEHYLGLVEAVLAGEHTPLRELPYLSQPERETLSRFGTTAPVAFPPVTLHALFEAQAERTPDAIAVACGTATCTYRQLDERANRLAHALRRKGVRPDQVVGILAERSMSMIAGLLGILKAGGAYLPLSPADPAPRLEYALHDSGATVLLLQTGWPGKVTFAGTVLDLEDPATFDGPAAALPAVNQPSDLAYVIYTSGSTGRPKGVMIGHRSVVNRLCWMQRRYPLGASDVILQKTSFAFDVSVWELFWWSLAGARVCLLAPGDEKSPAAIAEAIRQHGVTVTHFVPSMLNAFLDHLEASGEAGKLAGLKRVFASGEALKPAHAARFNRLVTRPVRTRLTNLYGPTEATVDVTYYDCPDAEETGKVPIGRPIDNTGLYILAHGQLQPAGIPGELCIGGAGVARGYINAAELTRLKFVADPFVPGQQMYRTGDLACWLPDGNIEYLGRMDHQVKIRGHRIEPGEIVNALHALPGITEAVVLPKPDGQNGDYLAAYLVGTGEVDAEQVRLRLAGTLPAAMIPSVFYQVPFIPVTANGKADTRALLATGETGLLAETVWVGPSNPEEEWLLHAFGQLLHVPHLGVTQNLFSVGLTSLKVIQAHRLIETRFPGKMEISQLFSNPTVQQMAQCIAPRAGHPLPEATANVLDF